jgi:hypothetical protein
LVCHGRSVSIVSGSVAHNISTVGDGRRRIAVEAVEISTANILGTSASTSCRATNILACVAVATDLAIIGNTAIISKVVGEAWAVI